MQAVLGYKGVTKHRGSITASKFGKCIPVIHPAAILRNWSDRPITACDFVKIKKESTCPEIVRQARELIVMPTLPEAMEELERLRAVDKIAFDIETETGQICCISFASSPSRSVSIPFWFGNSGSFWSAEDEGKLWDSIKALLEDSNVKKIAQNAQYDMTILQDIYGIKVSNLWLDTMIAFHAIYPELPKNLGLISSLYTDVPYYKYQRKTDDMVEFFRYNATDSIVTYECAEKIYAEMVELGVDKFYYEHMHSLIEPLMTMGRRGVLIDSQLKKAAIKEYKESINTLSIILEEQVGHPLNVNSPKQMKEWLYDELKLTKKYRGRGKKKTITADGEALLELNAAHDIPALKTIINLREKKKILSTYLEVKYDKEEDTERAKTSYLITGTETGRLSSRETVYGTGTNLQNVPKGIARRIFIPDSGKLFINGDLSQAEARVVAYLAGENRLIGVFSNGGDIHRRNAATIFKKPEEKVSVTERTLAKRIVHASNYGMGPRRFSKTCGIPEKEAKRLLNLYFATYPKIKLWHLKIKATLKKTRTLTTPLGRRRTFFNEWSDSLAKEAYAYIPQSTVADILNIGLRRIYDVYNNTDTEVLLQIHDAVIVQTPAARVDQTAREIKRMLSVPIRINGSTLTIPVDISVGTNWNDLRSL